MAGAISESESESESELSLELESESEESLSESEESEESELSESGTFDFFFLAAAAASSSSCFLDCLEDLPALTICFFVSTSSRLRLAGSFMYSSSACLLAFLAVLVAPMLTSNSVAAARGDENRPAGSEGKRAGVFAGRSVDGYYVCTRARVEVRGRDTSRRVWERDTSRSRRRLFFWFRPQKKRARKREAER